VTDGSPSRAEIERRRLREACEEFEGILTSYVFKTMRQSIVKSEEADQARDFYEAMLDDSVARELSQQENHGLAEMLYQQLLPIIEAKNESDGVPSLADPAKGIKPADR